MQVARKVMPTAQTEISADGNGALHWGVEDFCALLGLRPAAKYETIWERIAKAVRDHVPAANWPDAFRQMGTLLLLGYALRNADFNVKNLGLLYTGLGDVHLTPAYDAITTAAYPEYAHNLPTIAFMGRKTWDPGKTLKIFITAEFGVPACETDEPSNKRAFRGQHGVRHTFSMSIG